jgi:hypothetical protein
MTPALYSREKADALKKTAAINADIHAAVLITPPVSRHEAVDWYNYFGEIVS